MFRHDKDSDVYCCVYFIYLKTEVSFSDHFLSRVILSVRLPVPPLTFYNYDFFLRTTGHISTKTCNETLFGKWDTKDKSFFFFKNGHALFQGKIFKNDWKFWYFFQKSSFQWMFVKNSWNFCGSTLSYCKFKFVFSHDPQWQTRASIVDQIRTWGYIEKTTGQTIWLFLNYDSSDRVGP